MPNVTNTDFGYERAVFLINQGRMGSVASKFRVKIDWILLEIIALNDDVDQSGGWTGEPPAQCLFVDAAWSLLSVSMYSIQTGRCITAVSKRCGQKLMNTKNWSKKGPGGSGQPSSSDPQLGPIATPENGLVEQNGRLSSHLPIPKGIHSHRPMHCIA